MQLYRVSRIPCNHTYTHTHTHTRNDRVGRAVSKYGNMKRLERERERERERESERENVGGQLCTSK